MAFDTLESSRDSGAPIALFEFSSAGKTWRYTSDSVPTVALGTTFDPIPITYDRIILTAGADRRTTNITTTWGCGLAKHLLEEDVPWATTVKVYRAHSGDAEAVLVFTGIVENAQFGGGQMRLACATIGQGTPVPAQRQAYTQFCPWRVYGPNCRLDVLAALQTATANGITGLDVNMQPGWQGSKAKSDFVHGMFVLPVLPTWKHAFILKIDETNDVITISWPLSISPGQEVKVAPGCDKTAETCRDRFNNLQNYGGLLQDPSTGLPPFGG